jgi:hypothetical protein
LGAFVCPHHALQVSRVFRDVHCDSSFFLKKDSSR